MRYTPSSGIHLELDRRNGLIAGLCAGFARWLDIDVTWVRIGAVVAAVLLTKIAIGAYIIGWLLLDDRNDP